MVLVCISLMGNDVEHLFCVCWPSVCRLWRSVYLDSLLIFILCPFLNQVVYFLLIYMTSLCILVINCLSDKSFAHIFSHLVDYLLVSLIVPFAMQKLLSLIQSHLFILLLFPMPEETYQKKKYCNYCQRAYSLWFLLGSGWFQVLHLNPVHFEFIFVYSVIKQSSLFFTCSCPIFPAQLIKEVVFSPLYILVSLVGIN